MDPTSAENKILNASDKYNGPIIVVVYQESFKQYPYPHLYVNDDGTLRELHPNERIFLETTFIPGDGGRSAFKSSYSSLNGWGSIHGFCKRDRIPEEIVIEPTAGDSSTED